ncbi:MAG: hypothetical protein P1P85_02805 [Patescibacteria group bacterium]|nr:hypothetical protein [Patescibacteria group bacterium]
MKKLTINKIIPAIIVFVLIFLFVEYITGFEFIFFDILRYVSLVAMPAGIGFVFAVLFMEFAKKINSEKILKYTLFFSFVFLLLLFSYHLIYIYTDLLKNFYSYHDFEQFIYYYRYKGSLPFGQFFIDILTLLFMLNASFIGFISGFISNIYLSNIPNRKIKKRE